MPNLTRQHTIFVDRNKYHIRKRIFFNSLVNCRTRIFYRESALDVTRHEFLLVYAPHCCRVSASACGPTSVSTRGKTVFSDAPLGPCQPQSPEQEVPASATPRKKNVPRLPHDIRKILLTLTDPHVQNRQSHLHDLHHNRKTRTSSAKRSEFDAVGISRRTLVNLM